MSPELTTKSIIYYETMYFEVNILLNHTVNHATMFRDHLKGTKTAGHHPNET